MSTDSSAIYIDQHGMSAPFSRAAVLHGKKFLEKRRKGHLSRRFLTSSAITKVLGFTSAMALMMSASTAHAADVTFANPGTSGSWTVPAGVSEVTINSRGAAGGLGNSGTKRGGGGARTEVVVPVSAGDVIYYVVGEQGAGAGVGDGGGGGSTGVFLNGTLLTVAGGGAGFDNTGGADRGGLSTEDGGVGAVGGYSGNVCPPQTVAIGGAGGAGGLQECPNPSTGGGGGGGGINGAGQPSTNNAGGGGGADLNPLDGLSVAAGGVAGVSNGRAGGAGFTGGGGSDDYEAGAGGGYSGGAGANSGGSAGGGGSFVTTEIVLTSSSKTAGANATNTGDGEVKITYFFDPVEDFSDAPISGTSYGDATHTVASDILIGDSNDAEISSIANADATGDGADDDGVTFPVLKQGQSANISVDVKQPSASAGYLNGWIDWDGNGTFDSDEYVAQNRQLTTGTTGTIDIYIMPPVDAVANTFGRFRWSTDIALDPTAPASDGEVEDYAVSVLPSLVPPAPAASCDAITSTLLRPVFTSPTAQIPLVENDFVRFENVATLNGQVLDLIAEVDQLETLEELSWLRVSGGNVNARMTNGIPVGLGTVHEAHVRYTFVEDGGTTPVPVNVEVQIDDLDLSTATRRESISFKANELSTYFLDPATQLDVAYDGDNLTFLGTQSTNAGVAASAVKGVFENRSSFSATFRAEEVTSGKGITKVGFTLQMSEAGALGSCEQFDYSDSVANGSSAPVSGSTAYGVATHVIATADKLGTDITHETSSSASADDTSDDGIVVPELSAGETADIVIPTGDITASVAGTTNLYGWIDFDGDGTFEPGEFASGTVTNGVSGPLTFSGYGTTMNAGTTYARFRLTSTVLTSADFATAVGDGEVEDYEITVVAPIADLAITKTNTPGVNSEIDQDDDVLTWGTSTTFTLTVTNNGPDAVTGAVVTDSIVSGLTCAPTNAVTLSGDGIPTGSFTIADLTGSGIILDTLADGQSTTLTYTCEVN